MTGAYPVGLVGESNYQANIGNSRPGDHVRVLHEVKNPYDAQALVVLSSAGDKLGYIARDCWLRDAIHTEGHGCGAIIFAINPGPYGAGVVLNVQLTGEGVEQCAYRP